MSTYVVAGATGRVGSMVAKQLLERGEKVRIIVRAPQRGADWSRRGAEVAVGSLEDRGFLAGALEGAGGFFTLLPADLAGPDFHGIRRRITESTAAAVTESGAPRVVMLSATTAYLPDRNGPAQGLHHLENALRATGTKLTAARASYLQENIGAVLAPATQAGIYPNFMPSADAAFPMIATRDVGRFAAMLLAAPATRSEIVDLLGPAYSSRQLAERLGAALGKKLQVVDVPPGGQVAALTQAGLPGVIAEAVAEVYA